MVEAMLIGDRIGVMKDGRLLQIGTVEDLASNPADPYVSELISAPQRQASLVTAKLGRQGS
jgi:ABC-type proline/glycine betaine transport system ATPase subunit